MTKLEYAIERLTVWIRDFGEQKQPVFIDDLRTVLDSANEMKAVLADLIDPDPCRLDHHGYCQAHMWLNEEECPQARAKRLLGKGAGK